MDGLSGEELRGAVVSLFTPARRPVRPGAVGVELELLPILHAASEAGRRRCPLRGPGPSLTGFLTAYGEATERVAADWDEFGAVRFRTRRNGRLTFEPGGQLEFAGEPRATAREAREDLRAVLDPLRAEAAAAGLDLVARGADPWHDPEGIPLQLTAPRYRAMDAWFAGDPWGLAMMRCTASMQVNLDFGGPEVAVRRWRAANRLAPVLVAAFANSPGRLPGAGRVASVRSAVWRRLDPTRTGVATGAPGSAPWTAYERFALDARVMLRTDGAGGLDAAAARYTFRSWREEAAPPPPPSPEDWRVHLTTLFPEVRPRGWMEIRCLDVPRPEWWSVPLLVLPALLYDEAALAALLEMRLPAGPEALDTAAERGLSDAGLAEGADAVFALALAAAERFPPGYFDPEMRERTETFAERVVRGRLDQETAAGGRPAT